MDTIPDLDLDAGWSVDYFEHDPDLFEFADPFPVPSLKAWQPDARLRGGGWAAWLQRDFTLTVTDFCISYTLIIEALPKGASLHVNGRSLGVPIASEHAPASVDVTDVVALGVNRIGFRVDADTPGSFGALTLRTVLCD